MEREPTAAPRQQLREAIGDAAVVDACAVVAQFNMMTRIADTTGIPLDAPLELITQQMRDEMGVDAFGSAGNTGKSSALRRGIGRAIQPMVPSVFRLVGRMQKRLVKRGAN